MVLIPFRKSGWENSTLLTWRASVIVLIPFRKSGWENWLSFAVWLQSQRLNPLQEIGVGKRQSTAAR